MPNFPFVTWQEVLGEDFSRLIGNDYLDESELQKVRTLLSFIDAQICAGKEKAKRMAELIPSYCNAEDALRIADEVALCSFLEDFDREMAKLLEEIDVSRRKIIKEILEFLLKTRLERS